MLHVGDVHRAALAVAVPVVLAEELGHHLLDVAAFGDGVSVAAVRAPDAVIRPKRRTGADRDRLRADVGVRQAVDLVLHPELFHVNLELPDENDLAEHLDLLFGGEIAGRLQRRIAGKKAKDVFPRRLAVGCSG